jgi:hypothetical protein
MPSAESAFHITGASAKVQLFTRQLLQYAAVNAKVQLFGSWKGKYAPCASNNCTFAG